MTVNYNFQFIKYEIDDGFLFKDLKDFNGISFSDMTFFNSHKDDYNIEKRLKEDICLLISNNRLIKLIISARRDWNLW